MSTIERQHPNANAARQAAYRARAKATGIQLNVFISNGAKAALEAIAAAREIPQRAALELALTAFADPLPSHPSTEHPTETAHSLHSNADDTAAQLIKAHAEIARLKATAHNRVSDDTGAQREVARLQRVCSDYREQHDRLNARLSVFEDQLKAEDAARAEKARQRRAARRAKEDALIEEADARARANVKAARDARILELAGLSEKRVAETLQAEGIECSPRTVGNVRKRLAS